MPHFFWHSWYKLYIGIKVDAKVVVLSCCCVVIEVKGIDNAPVKICHLSIGITAMTVIKLIITNSLNLFHTKK